MAISAPSGRGRRWCPGAGAASLEAGRRAVVRGAVPPVHGHKRALDDQTL